MEQWKCGTQLNIATSLEFSLDHSEILLWKLGSFGFDVT